MLPRALGAGKASVPEGYMQFVVLIAAVVVSLGAALGTAAGILKILFLVMSRLR